MTVNLTDSDTFTDPVRAPDDGDPANGATFQAGLQDLANRTRNHKNRLDTLSGRALCLITTGATVAPADLTLSVASSGITLVGGNSVELPVGSWWIAAKLVAVSSDNSNPVHLTATIRVGGGILVTYKATRYNTDTTLDVLLAPSAPATISDPATQRVSVEVTASAGIPAIETVDGLAYLSLHKIPPTS